MNKNIRKAIIIAPLATVITFGGMTGAFANEVAPVSTTAPVASTAVAGSAFGAAAETAPEPVLVDTPAGPVDGSTLPVPVPVGSTVEAPGEAPVPVAQAGQGEVAAEPVLVDTPEGEVPADTLPVPEPVGSVVEVPEATPVPVENAPVVNAPVVEAHVEDVPAPETPEAPVEQDPVQSGPVVLDPITLNATFGTTHNTPATIPTLNPDEAASGYTAHSIILVSGAVGATTLNLPEGTATVVGTDVVFTPKPGFAGAVRPITITYVQTSPDGQTLVPITKVVNLTVAAAPVAEQPTTPAPVLPTTPEVEAPVVEAPVKDAAPVKGAAPVIGTPVKDAAPVADDVVVAPVAGQGDVAPAQVPAGPADASQGVQDAVVAPVLTVEAPAVGGEDLMVPSVFSDAPAPVAVAGEEAQVKELPVGAPDTGVEVLAETGPTRTGLFAGLGALLAAAGAVILGRKRTS